MVDIANWDRESLVNEENNRLQRIAARWKYYNGDFPDPMQQMQDHPNDNVKVNKCKLIVIAGVTFLFGKEITFELNETEVTTEQEQYLADVWNANKKMTRLQQLATNGGVTGHAFVKLEPTSPITNGLPRLIVLDPSNVTPMYQEDDIEDVYGWKIQFNATEARTGKRIIMRERYTRAENGQSWEIVNDYCYPNAEVFTWLPLMVTQTKWIETNRQVWPHAWAPIFHCQNYPCANEFWGESDIPDDVVNLNLSKNLNLSLGMRHQVFRGYPQIWASGLNNNSGEPLEWGPLKIVPLNTGGQMGVLDSGANPAMAQWLDEAIDRALHELAMTPEIAMGKVDNLGSVSGVALRILYQPLLSRTETKQQTYGDMLQEINARVLELKGLGTNVYPENKWKDPLPKDLLQMAQAAVLQSQFGYSNETLIRETGGDPATEAVRREQEAQGLGATVLQQFDRGGVPSDTAQPAMMQPNGNQPGQVPG